MTQIEEIEETGQFISVEKVQREQNAKIPIDRGWAWFVLAGAMLTMLIMVGGIRASGILFLIFQDKFGTTSATTSLISTVKSGLFCLTGTLVMTVGLKFSSCRTLVLLGSILIFVSFIATAFSDNFSYILLFQGAIQGLAFACLEGPAMSLVTKYFDKRRGLGNSLTSAGSALGGLIFPSVVTVMFEKYGYFGGMMLLAALNLHIAVGAALLRPQSFYYQHKDQSISTDTHTIKETASSIKKSTLLKKIIDSFDFKLFLNPLFVLFQIAFGFLTTADYMNILLTPPLGKDVRLSEQEMATLLTVYSVIDLCSRVAVGVFADLRKCRRSTILGICACVFGISNHCVRVYSSFELLLLHSVISGLTGSAVIALFAGIIVDYLTLEKLDPSIAFAMLSMSLCQACFAYVGGMLRDVTGTYVTTYHLIGTLALSGGAIMLGLPLVEKWILNRRTKQDTGECDVLSRKHATHGHTYENEPIT